MFDSVFDVVRLKAGTSKILADIPNAKRSGNSMLYAVDSMIHLAPESTMKARSTLVKGAYMKRIKKLLESEPQVVIDMLERVRTSLFRFENTRVLVIADIQKLTDPVMSWNILTSGMEVTNFVLPIEQQWKRLSPAGQRPGGIGATLVPMGAIDSSFCVATAQGPTSYTDPRIPALMVAVSYLDAVEGPMWTAVRGTGLAYGTGFSRDIDGGFMQFRVYRSPDAFKAFAASKSMVEGYIDGKFAFEDHALEGAVSAIVVAIADDQPTMASAAQTTFTNAVVRGLEPDYLTNLLRQVRKVSVDEIKQAMKDLLLPVFTPGTANIVVTCAPIMEEVRRYLCILCTVLTR